MFKLNKVILPNKMKVKNYSSILKLIEKNPNIIAQYVSDKDNVERYYKLLYTLLLFFNSNYDSKELSYLLSKKELWKYYEEILPMNHKYFSNIILSEELINEILKQKNLNYEIIKGTLSYLDSFEKVLTCINNNIEIIYECLEKEGKKIKLSEFVNPKVKDNIKIIDAEIKKILKYQSNKKEEFIIIDKDYLNNYIIINDEKKKIKKIKKNFINPFQYKILTQNKNLKKINEKANIKLKREANIFNRRKHRSRKDNNIKNNRKNI
jgi:hypothetical protein